MVKIHFFLLYIVFMASCESFMYNTKDLKSILGVETKISDKAYGYSEFAGMQGEGYIF